MLQPNTTRKNEAPAKIVGSLDFHPLEAIMRSSIPTLRWCQRRPSMELGLSSPLGGNKPPLPVMIVRTHGKPGLLYISTEEVSEDTCNDDLSQPEWYQQVSNGELELPPPPPSSCDEESSPHLCQQRPAGETGLPSSPSTKKVVPCFSIRALSEETC